MATKEAISVPGSTSTYLSDAESGSPNSNKNSTGKLHSPVFGHAKTAVFATVSGDQGTEVKVLQV